MEYLRIGLITRPHGVHGALKVQPLSEDLTRYKGLREAYLERGGAYEKVEVSDVSVQPDARINTESPAWAVDRLSILALKIYHMREQVERKDASEEHVQKCQAKLNVLLEQQVDLGTAIDQLLEDIEAGRKYMKVYRQMKMYNDPSTNPVLYNNKK